MNEKLKVKVVKREEINTSRPASAKINNPRNSAREMVSTVTEWVADFKERKSIETKTAIERFFVSHPQPSES